MKPTVASEGLERALQTIAQATSSVELGASGYAGTVTDTCAAYETLSQHPEALRERAPQLVHLIKTGPPGAVVYAALLLRQLDDPRLEDLLQPYLDDLRPCTIFPGGCMGVTHWLCEAVRWVCGETWSHPARLLESLLEGVEHANWLELPNETVLGNAMRDEGRQGQQAQGVWTYDFAEVWFSVHLASVRERVEKLLARKELQIRIYGALLLYRLDPQAGDKALADLATGSDKVLMLIGRKCAKVKLAQGVDAARQWICWAQELERR